MKRDPDKCNVQLMAEHAPKVFLNWSLTLRVQTLSGSCIAPDDQLCFGALRTKRFDQIEIVTIVKRKKN